MPKRRVQLLMGYYVREIHHGVASFACEKGWELDASMTHFGVIPRRSDCDGILAFSGDRPDIIARITEAGIPAVDMFNGRRLTGVPQVLIDNFAIGRTAGEFLVSKGFRDIGYFFFDPALANPDNETERSCGLEQAVTGSGRSFHRVGFKDALTTIASLPKPLALMAQNDMVGDHLIRSLLESGVRVPQEVAVVAVDSDTLYQIFSPVPQTSIDSNIRFQGYAAADLLQSLMDGGEPPGDPVMIPPVRVVERASTSFLKSSHPAVAKAMDFISSHLGDGIEAKHVAVHAGMSLYQLNDHFKRHVDDTVSKHLHRARIERARHLLAETDDKVQVVALDLGFCSASHFTTVFQNATGITPGEFRRRTRLRLPTDQA